MLYVRKTGSPLSEHNHQQRKHIYHKQPPNEIVPTIISSADSEQL